MPQSKKRKKRSAGGHSSYKRLYLPLDRASIDQMAVSFRVAFEAVRQGRYEVAAARCMMQVVLLTTFVSEAGHGLISPAVLDDAENALYDVFKTFDTTGQWVFPEILINQLREIVNEHERQLHETRMQVIVQTTEQLSRLIETSGYPLSTEL